MEMVTTGRFPAAKDAEQELSPYLMRRHELTIQQGCLMWGVRVIVPPKLRSCVLQELHTAHPGMFCSEEFGVFLKANGVKHIRSAPYHPATNGLAERFVQTFKHALKASRGSAPVQQRLDTFLLTYRNTPHATTREMPAMLFIGRKLRSRLDFLKPSVA
uniref:Integrase catalytic domain-containing protein n=1 Tax=Nothobranchius pienaari TaxID=704102 RepID=A0A1A8MV40_9TELE